LLKEGLASLGCRLSPKSLLLATDSAFARELQESFMELGIEVKTPVSGRDLGVDVSLGRRRRTAILQTRAKAARQRLVKAKCAVKVCRSARRLVTAGALPQLSWGRAAIGTAPVEVQRLRAAVAAGLGIRRSGGCCTTAFLVSGYGKNDPAVQYPLEQCGMVCKVLAGREDLHRAFGAAVRKLGPVLTEKTPQQLWHWARGPVSAFLATAVSLGWKVSAGGTFIDQDAIERVIDFRLPESREQLLRVMRRAVQRRLWQQAALHYAGGGSEHGVDATVALRRRRRLLRQERAQELGTLDAVVQGAVWPEDRLRESGYITDGRCPACQEAAKDTLLHFYWECDRHRDSSDPAIVKSQDLVAEARRGAAEDPILWLRGLQPQRELDAAIGDFLLPVDGDGDIGIFEWGCFADGGLLEEMPSGAFAATDGSGGAHLADSRLRRVSFGLALFAADCTMLGFIGGGVPGEQTINRAELFAVVMLARRLPRATRLPVAVDSSFVLRPGSEDEQSVRGGTVHLDLWGELRRRQPEFVFHKVKSHLDWTAAEAQGYPLWSWLGNQVADAVAGAIGQRLQLPPQVVLEVEALDRRAERILRRLTAVVQATAAVKRPLRERAAPAAEEEVAEAAAGSGEGEVPAELVLEAPRAAHRWQAIGAEVSVCVACSRGARGSELLPSGQCPGAIASQWAEGVHPSHRRGVLDGLRFCTACGSWAAKRAVELQAQCRPATAAGKATLRALGRGAKPPGLPNWPEGPVR